MTGPQILDPIQENNEKQARKQRNSNRSYDSWAFISNQKN